MKTVLDWPSARLANSLGSKLISCVVHCKYNSGCYLFLSLLCFSCATDSKTILRKIWQWCLWCFSRNRPSSKIKQAYNHACLFPNLTGSLMDNSKASDSSYCPMNEQFYPTMLEVKFYFSNSDQNQEFP